VFEDFTDTIAVLGRALNVLDSTDALSDFLALFE
jgi:hypothetical protein